MLALFVVLCRNRLFEIIASCQYKGDDSIDYRVIPIAAEVFYSTVVEGKVHNTNCIADSYKRSQFESSH